MFAYKTVIIGTDQTLIRPNEILSSSSNERIFKKPKRY